MPGTTLFGLRKKREEANLTQGELAERLSAIDPTGAWDQSKVSRYEAHEAGIPAGALMLMLRVLGDTNIVVERPTPRGADIGEPNKELVDALISRATPLPGLVSRWSNPLRDVARLVARRPRIGMVGPYDAGKTTLINTLLGANALRASYQPQTFAITYLHHISSRPTNRLEAVYLMRDGFDPNAWTYGTDFADDDIVASGPLELLTRTDDFATPIGQYAMVFLDAPILRACTLVDSPGTLETDTTAEQDDVATLTVSQLDGVVVCSPCAGFMNTDSLTHVRDALALLGQHDESPLERLLIVATHAHAKVTDQRLQDEIIPMGSQRIARWLEAHTSGADHSPITAEEIAAKVVPFDPDASDRAARFVATFEQWLGQSLGVRHARRAIETVSLERTLLAAGVDEEINSILATKSTLAKAEQMSASDFKAHVDRSTQDLFEVLRKHRVDSLAHAFDTAAKYDPARIESIITSKFKSKKEAKEEAPLYVMELINREISKDLEARLAEVQSSLEEWVGGLECKIPKFTTSEGASTFSFRSRMFGAAAGAGFGFAGTAAAGAYAASLGNLGAYILVAKGVSLLSGLGISVGGVAPAVSFVSFIGGPVTIGIAAIVALTLAGFALVGGNWKKTLAKQIHKKLVTEVLFPDPLQKGKKREHPGIPEGLSEHWKTIGESIAIAAEAAKAAYEDIQREYEDAIAAYEASGEVPPTREDLERTRDWLALISFDDLLPNPADTTNNTPTNEGR